MGALGWRLQVKVQGLLQRVLGLEQQAALVVARMLVCLIRCWCAGAT